MKKKILTSLLATTLAFAMVLTGCGNTNEVANTVTDNSEETTTASGETLYTPTLNGVQVELPDYSNIDVSSVARYVVTDDDIQSQIDSLLTYFSTANYLEEGTVEEGSNVYISFTGSIDGVADENLASEGYELTIGSDYMIDGFEDGLIGASVGDTVTLNLTFPEDYGYEEYNGKAVTFEVTIVNLVTYETSEWNDEFVSTNLEYASTQEYEDFLWEDMQAYYDDLYTSDVTNAIVEYLLENSVVTGIPDEEIASYKQEGIDYYTAYAESYSMEYEDFIIEYLQYEDIAEFEADLDMQTMNDLNYKYIALAIAESEGQVLTTDDYDAYINEMAEYYGSDYDTIKADIESDMDNLDEIYAAALCNKVMAQIASAYSVEDATTTTSFEESMEEHNHTHDEEIAESETTVEDADANVETQEETETTVESTETVAE